MKRPMAEGRREKCRGIDGFRRGSGISARGGRLKEVCNTRFCAVWHGSFVLFAAIFLLGCNPRTAEPEHEHDSRPSRIVSTAPSITETLYQLGCGDRIVGVSRFCAFPPEAKEKTNVGGFLDPNLEVLVGLRPDLVILLDSAGPLKDGIEKLGIPQLTVENRTVDEILDSFRVIGKRCGVEEKAEALINSLNARIARVAEHSKGKEKPRVLFVVSRLLGSGDIRDVYVAADDGYFSRLIELAGGTNACPAGAETFPVVSVEGLIQMNPDIILDASFTTEPVDDGAADTSALNDWKSLNTLTAVKTGRVYQLRDDFARVPGPRFVELLEKMAELIP